MQVAALNVCRRGPDVSLSPAVERMRRVRQSITEGDGKQKESVCVCVYVR